MGMSTIGKRIGLVDERSEIAGCLHGIPQNDLGIRTDVLDGCPKVEGMMLLVRSMAPEILAVDEIGGAEDFAAMEYAMHCGCRFLATVHAAVWKNYFRSRDGTSAGRKRCLATMSSFQKMGENESIPYMMRHISVLHDFNGS